METQETARRAMIARVLGFQGTKWCLASWDTYVWDAGAGGSCLLGGPCTGAGDVGRGDCCELGFDAFD